ncbi:GTPase HflX [Merdibacter massiliensis]|uniref:GTPase HflX n=1 Tax=Merdibacter massiliensis TaxID=1871030 RepID=UPI00096AB310|nr:GTPase HflX [Merdibacter massiliensis]
MKQRVLIAGVWEQNNMDFQRQMEELEGLSNACDMEVVDRISQKMTTRHPATYFGSGRLLEIKERIEEMNVQAVVLLHECTPSQLHHLEKALSCTVIDRTELILQIFERRARTKEARIQVQMALCQYALPRLIHSSDHWSRQAGGRNKGKGEQQLALDKRLLQKQIRSLRQELKQIQSKKQTQRRSRQQSILKKIALIGYTNAGKSTILNRLLEMSNQKTEKKVLEKDMLFATLDTNVRLIHVKGHTPFLLSDTVGFLEQMPDALLDAFDATLKEAMDADLLLHVIDASDPQFAEKRKVTIETLRRIHCGDVPSLEIYNKIDRCKDLVIEQKEDKLFLSALQNEGMELLLEALDQKQWQDSLSLQWKFPYDQQQLLSSFYHYVAVYDRKEKADGIYLQGKIPVERRLQFQHYEINEY